MRVYWAVAQWSASSVPLPVNCGWVKVDWKNGSREETPVGTGGVLLKGREPGEPGADGNCGLVESVKVLTGPQDGSEGTHRNIVSMAKSETDAV
jgi:hypothetical protein